MPTMTTEVRSRGRAECDGADVRVWRPIPGHYVVVRHGDEGLEVLRVPVGGRGETLPVFSAGWAARGHLFAEAPGGGWNVKACAPDELTSLLAGPCARVEWVALDPRPQRERGGKRHAAGELRGLPVGFDASLFLLRWGYFRTSEGGDTWAKRQSLAEGRKLCERQRYCWTWRTPVRGAAASSMAGPRSWFAGAGKQPSKSSASSRSRTALQTVKFTRRRA